MSWNFSCCLNSSFSPHSLKDQLQAVRRMKQEAAGSGGGGGGNNKSWSCEMQFLNVSNWNFFAVLLSWPMTAWLAWLEKYHGLTWQQRNTINISVVDVNGLFTLCVVYCVTCVPVVPSSWKRLELTAIFRVIGLKWVSWWILYWNPELHILCIFDKLNSHV